VYPCNLPFGIAWNETGLGQQQTLSICDTVWAKVSALVELQDADAMNTEVLFDLDDTLHDRTGAIPLFAREQGRTRLNLPEHEARAFAARFVELEQRGRVWKDQVYNALSLEFPAARNQRKALVDDYLQSFPRRCRLRPGVLELLNALRSNLVKIGLVTNGRVDMQSAVIDALGLVPVVDTIVISEQVGLRKPQPEIFHLALNRLGASRRSATFVGDDLLADVGGALSAGIARAVWFDEANDAKGVIPTGAVRITTIEALSTQLLRCCA
jgi:putative hydrolase of the HAD superfamily